MPLVGIGIGLVLALLVMILWGVFGKIKRVGRQVCNNARSMLLSQCNITSHTPH